MVRATQKGEMENPSPEIAKVASSVSKSDVKKMASTKHKGLPEKKKIEEVAFLAAAGKVALAAGKGMVKQKAKQVVAQKAVNVAKGAIPQPNRDQQESYATVKKPSEVKKKAKLEATLRRIEDIKKKQKQVKEGVGRAAIGAGVGALVGGPVGAAAGAAIGASLGKKKVTTGGNKVKKKATNFFKAEPKVTRSEEVEVVDEAAKDQSNKQLDRGMKTTQKAMGVIDNSPYGKLSDDKVDRMNKRLRDRRKDVSGEKMSRLTKSLGLKKEEFVDEKFATQYKDKSKLGQSSQRKSLGRGSSINPDAKPSGYESKKEHRVTSKKLAKYQTKGTYNAHLNTEAKVDAGKDDVTKEDDRNKRKFGHVPYNQHGHSVLRRAMHRSDRKVKKIKGLKEPANAYGEQVKMEGVMDIVRKYNKKKEEKKPDKAQDAGARARRALKRREYQSKVSSIVPSELEDQKVWDKIKKHI